MVGDEGFEKKGGGELTWARYRAKNCRGLVIRGVNSLILVHARRQLLDLGVCPGPTNSLIWLYVWDQLIDWVYIGTN